MTVKFSKKSFIRKTYSNGKIGELGSHYFSNTKKSTTFFIFVIFHDRVDSDRYRLPALIKSRQLDAYPNALYPTCIYFAQIVNGELILHNAPDTRHKIAISNDRSHTTTLPPYTHTLVIRLNPPHTIITLRGRWVVEANLIQL